MSQPVFDDTYEGPRWIYGLTNRPLGFAQVPDGWIIWSDRSHHRYRHGTVDYPRELAAHEVEAFELKLVSGPKNTEGGEFKPDNPTNQT